MRTSTYCCCTEFKDLRIISLLLVLNLPWGGGIVSESTLLGELHVMELPSGGDLGHVREVDMDGSIPFNIDLAEVKLVKSIVVL